MRSAKTLVIGILLVAAGPGLHAQTQPAASAGAKAKPPAPTKIGSQAATPGTAAKPAAAAAKPTASAAKPTVKPAQPSKPAAADQTAQAGKPPVKKTPKVAKPVEKPADTSVVAEARTERRDPFESFLNKPKVTPNLPPGKAGLQVSTLRLDGIVKAPNGMIAVVTNPQARTYFLREGDQLYDGKVEKIAMDGVSFHEMGKDAFGKPVEREVNKRIYSSGAGEQQ
jgi:hypothetical protein